MYKRANFADSCRTPASIYIRCLARTHHLRRGGGGCLPYVSVCALVPGMICLIFSLLGASFLRHGTNINSRPHPLFSNTHPMPTPPRSPSPPPPPRLCSGYGSLLFLHRMCITRSNSSGPHKQHRPHPRRGTASIPTRSFDPPSPQGPSTLHPHKILRPSIPEHVLPPSPKM